MFGPYFFAGCCLWGAVLLTVYFLRVKSRIHVETMESFGRRKKILLLSVILIVILACTAPMGLSPVWNGERPGHRNQYEVLTDCILDGHFYVTYYVDPLLLEMENPYDPAAREELQVEYPWDHAFYNGRYYVYFGIVPVFLLFLPFRVITGSVLASFHATQFFVAAFICGVFATFFILARKFFPRMTFVSYLFLSSALSVLSIWHSIAAPALYCTAITSGLCMEIWSMFFFIRAVWMEEEEKRSIWMAFLGSLFGALAFGCRPPIALGNLLVIPMLAEYLRRRHINGKLFLRLLFAALPYVVVGCLLMLYNYVRFENPFEFGQTYQLTVADQTSYSNFFGQFDLIKSINGILENFISYTPLVGKFPYVDIDNGAFVNFPILALGLLILTRGVVREKLRENHLLLLAQGLILLPVLITVVDAAWVPELGERYRMDIYWLMGILCFLALGFYGQCCREGQLRKFSCGVSIFSLFTLWTCFILFLVPHDGNYTEYYPEALAAFEKLLTLGLSAS